MAVELALATAAVLTLVLAVFLLVVTYNNVIALQRRFNRWHPGDREQIQDRLRVAWLWALTDPILWLSLYQVLVDHTYFGRRWRSLPMLCLGPLRLLPRARLRLLHARRGVGARAQARAL